jgi:hypothetical protein
MKLWYKPPIYIIIHTLSGFIGYFFPVVLFFIVLYHVLQYAFDIRLFFFDLNYKPGNSLEHTGLKLFEVLIGYLLAVMVMKLRNKKEESKLKSDLEDR